MDGSQDAKAADRYQLILYHTRTVLYTVPTLYTSAQTVADR